MLEHQFAAPAHQQRMQPGDPATLLGLGQARPDLVSYILRERRRGHHQTCPKARAKAGTKTRTKSSSKSRSKARTKSNQQAAAIEADHGMFPPGRHRDDLVIHPRLAPVPRE
jgi:hypothetical protein